MGRCPESGRRPYANFGYTYELVPHCTRQRRWEEAQAKVEVTQRKLAEREEAIVNLWAQLKQLKQTYAQEGATQQAGIETRREELTERMARFQRRRWRLIERLCPHRARRAQTAASTAEQEAVRDAIDIETLCRERHLEKDQIMLDLQVLLTSLHDWGRRALLRTRVATAGARHSARLIYRKPGRVTWYADRIEVVLDAYRYADQQRAMEATCRRFNEAHLC